MTAAMTSLFVLWGSIIAVWNGLLVAQFLLRRRGLLLEPRPETVSDSLTQREEVPEVCVVIPARNEGSGLRSCVDSVLRQDYRRLRVTIIDDRSEDDTAAVAQEFAQADPRVHVITVASLPEGWLGKSHALWQGTRTIAAEWLLFLDADCRLEPWAVSTAIAEAKQRGVDLLSLWPRQAAGSFWEHMTIPLCAGIIALWFGAERVNRPRGPAAFANGQFLLIRRTAYERIDGHRAVRSALIEDIPLAELAKEAGIPCRVASGRNLVSVRMYRDYAAICGGWARIYVGALRSSIKILVSILWLVFGSLLPYGVAAGLLMELLVRTSPSADPAWQAMRILMAGFCASHLAILYVVSYRFWGLGACPRSYLWLYPVSVGVVIGILFRSLYWLGIKRRVPWRGTFYAITRKGAIMAQPSQSGMHAA